MRPEAYQIFAQLCESLVTETSTAISTFRSKKGGLQVAQHLHQAMNLPHNLEYNSLTKISWSELKDAANGSWVLIVGDKGSGAIKYDGIYKAVASKGDGIETFSNDRGGNILDFLKGQIGGLRQFYVAFQDKSYRDTVRARRKRDADAQQGPTAQTTETLVQKFKPLWVKALTTAIADIKGMVANQIKNDAFEKATKKLARLTEMNNAIDNLQSGDLDNAPQFVQSAVTLAVYMAASHYYPDQTGEISRAYNGYTVDNRKGTTLILADISNGDQKKLGTVLAFFKRNLISG